MQEINLKNYPNINLEYYSKVKRFADGRVNTFTGITKYKKVYDLSKKIFKDAEFFEVEPYFFEIHENVEGEGIVVDAKKLEIRLNEKEGENFHSVVKLKKIFGKNNLDYKIVRKAD